MNPKTLIAIALLAHAATTQAGEPFVFRDIGAEVGLHAAVKNANAHAAAWGDADGDGKLDLFVGTFADKGGDAPVPNAFLWNDGGKFVADPDNALHSAGRGTGSVLVDLDNDGLLDLYVSNHTSLKAAPDTGAGRRNILYHARPGRKFEDISAASGAVPQDFVCRNIAVMDYDGDGLLDLFLCHASVGVTRRGKGGALQPPPADAKPKSILLRNLGGMKFEVANDKAKIPADVYGLGSAVADLTGDGWPDLFVGGSNRLFLNQGDGTFREATELKPLLDWGAYSEDDAPSAGVAIGDYDRDGKLDLVIGNHPKKPWTEPRPIRLFRNLGTTNSEAKFEEVTEKAGLVPLPMKAPHVEIRDFDNDGWLDIYSAIIVNDTKGRTRPVIFRNLGAPAGKVGVRFEETAFVHRPDFPDEADRSGGGGTGPFYEKLLRENKVQYMATGPTADFDGDGRLDIFLASWWAEQNSQLLKNESKAGNWLAVTVTGTKENGVNRQGIGAVVRAYKPGQLGKPDALLASEEIATGYGYTSGQPTIAHLGLGAAETVDVEVILPHGKGRIVKESVKASQRLGL